MIIVSDGLRHLSYPWSIHTPNHWSEINQIRRSRSFIVRSGAARHVAAGMDIDNTPVPPLLDRAEGRGRPSGLLLERTEQLIDRIKPARHSEERRRAIAGFVSNVIARCFAPSKVSARMFGSVPLKTYLPGACMVSSHRCANISG